MAVSRNKTEQNSDHHQEHHDDSPNKKVASGWPRRVVWDNGTACDVRRFHDLSSVICRFHGKISSCRWGGLRHGLVRVDVKWSCAPMKQAEDDRDEKERGKSGNHQTTND